VSAVCIVLRVSCCLCCVSGKLECVWVIWMVPRVCCVCRVYCAASCVNMLSVVSCAKMCVHAAMREKVGEEMLTKRKLTFPMRFAHTYGHRTLQLDLP